MYVNKGSHILEDGTLGELNAHVSGVAGRTWYVVSACQITRLLAVVSTVFVSTVPAVITFRYRPTPKSSSGQSSIGTLTVGSSGGVAAVGTCWYKDITPFSCLPGAQIVTDVTTINTTSGKVEASFEAVDHPQNALALSAMHAG